MNGNMSKILQVKVNFKFICSMGGILKGMLWSPTQKKKKKKIIDVEIINDKFYKNKSLYTHAFKTFKNIIALQDIQIIYLSWHFVFPPFFSHLNLDSIKIANFSIMIFILSSKNVKKI